MKLDNQTITVGDNVYDLAFGAGIVQSLTIGVGFQVRFADGFEQSYNENGVSQFPNKTLYTKRPEIKVPFGDPVKDVQFGRIVRAVYEALKV